jgi:type III pantothenate kinase
MIVRIKEELKNPNLKVIATGGLISLIAAHCKEKIHVIDDNLTLKGILNIYKRNI